MNYIMISFQRVWFGKLDKHFKNTDALLTNYQQPEYIPIEKINHYQTDIIPGIILKLIKISIKFTTLKDYRRENTYH